MPSLADVLIGFALGASAGSVLGWMLSSRQRKQGSPEEGFERLEQELRLQIAAREEALQQARLELTEIQAARIRAETEHSALAHRFNEQQSFHREQLARHQELTAKALVDLRETFKALSLDALRQTQPEFLRLAQESLSRFHEIAKGDLGVRQQAIASLLDPVRQQLDSYQQRLQQAEQAQSSALGAVQQHLETLTLHSQELSAETFQLRRILGSNQARGRWGEETLRRVVESAGLSVHCDFTEQVMANDTKPDLVVRLPGARSILVDAKVPDLEFLGHLGTENAVPRSEALQTHASKFRATIKSLADRNYPAKFPGALDHVVLFVPSESLFSTALESDPELLLWAAQRQILLATPASLIGLLRAIAVSWQQHDQTENAREIAVAARELYARVSRFTEHLERIRDGVAKAAAACNDAIGSYDRMVRPSGERLARLGGGMEGRSFATLEPIAPPIRTHSPPASSAFPDSSLPAP